MSIKLTITAVKADGGEAIVFTKNDFPTAAAIEIDCLMGHIRYDENSIFVANVLEKETNPTLTLDAPNTQARITVSPNCSVFNLDDGMRYRLRDAGHPEIEGDDDGTGHPAMLEIREALKPHLPCGIKFNLENVSP